MVLNATRTLVVKAPNRTGSAGRKKSDVATRQPAGSLVPERLWKCYRHRDVSPPPAARWPFHRHLDPGSRRPERCLSRVGVLGDIDPEVCADAAGCVAALRGRRAPQRQRLCCCINWFVMLMMPAEIRSIVPEGECFFFFL